MMCPFMIRELDTNCRMTLCTMWSTERDTCALRTHFDKKKLEGYLNRG